MFMATWTGARLAGGPKSKRKVAMQPITRGVLTGLAALSLAATTLMPAVAASKPATPSAPVNLGTFNAWTAWKGQDADGLMCYVSAAPKTTLPVGANRDPVHFLVVNRIGRHTKDEVQTLVGYPLEINGTFSATIDGKSYAMITTKDDPKTATNENYAAWLRSAADQPGFVAALKAGSSLVVKGVSQRGTHTTDTYSLAGITAALQKIATACK